MAGSLNWRRIGALCVVLAAAACFGLAFGAPAKAQSTDCLAAQLPESEFTEAERAAWRTLCESASGYVDMSVGDNAGCAPNSDAVWPETRNLSQKFFDTILFEEPYRSARRGPLVEVFCATLPEELRLDYQRIEPAFFINNSRLDGGLSMSYARADRTLSFQGNRVTGDMNFEHLRIVDNLFIRGGANVSGATLLRGAQIGGNLEAGGSVYGEPNGDPNVVVFNADSMSVGGSVFMSQGAVYNGEVRLVAVEIEQGLEMGDATYFGRVNADSVTSGSSVFMVGATFHDEVVFRASTIRGGVEAGGGTFNGPVFFDRCDIGGSVFTREATFKDQANLVSTRIGESIEFGGADFQSVLNLESVQVAKSVFFNNSVKFGSWVNLRYSDIGSNIVADGAQFSDRLYGEGMRVRRSVLLRGPAVLINGLVFNDAQIEGSIRMGGAAVHGGVGLRNTKVDGDLDFANAPEDQAAAVLQYGIEMQDADVAGSVLLYGAVIDGRVNMTGADVDGALALSGDAGDPSWGPNSRLTLRETRVEELVARLSAWRVVRREDGGEDGVLPLASDLTGFIYNRWVGYDGDLGSGTNSSMMPPPEGMSREDLVAADLVVWIESQQGAGGQPHAAVYNPQPYEQLAKAMSGDGQEEIAKQIEYARFEHRRIAGNTPAFEQYFLSVMKYVNGYGLYPLLAGMWFSGLLLLGWFVALFSPGIRNLSVFEKFWYSLDNMLPILSLNDLNHRIRHRNDIVGAFFYVQRMLGWVLALSVGAIGFLT